MLQLLIFTQPKPEVSSENPTPGSKQITTRLVTRLAILLTAMTIAGCGGSGGGNDSTGLVAYSKSVQVIEDLSTDISLYANDPENDPLTYRIDTPASKGTIIIIDDTTGAINYVPNTNETGADSFTFIANDGSSDSNIATVTVTIDAVNDAPVVLTDSYTMDQGSTTELNLAANDSDIDDGLDLNSIAIISPPDNGSLIVNTNGTVDYSHSGSQTVDDSFTYTIDDLSGATSNTATVNLTITLLNNPPVATGSCSTIPQAQTLIGSLSATDPDSGETLTYQLEANGSGGAGPITTAMGGTVNITNTATGDYTYLPASGAGSERGLDSFEFQVSDSVGASDSATETVIVDQKIMPLGDSITAGEVWLGSAYMDEIYRISYRKELRDLLTSGGYNFDFVGSVTTDGTDPSIAPFIDIQHEGHGGWSALQITVGRVGGYPTDGVRAWLDDNPADIILLHIGTNQLSSTSSTDIGNILDDIDTWENSVNGNPVTVLLALIIDQNIKDNPDVATFNASVSAMVQARTTDDIIIVDQQTVVDYDTEMSDNAHPNANGYTNMAGAWFTELDNPAVLDKCP